MKPRSKWIVTPLFVLLLLWAARGGAAPLWYSSPVLEARVVDDGTGQPLAGVVAVAHWELRGGLIDGRTIGQLVVLETVTNADGQCSFPAWGPKLRPLFGWLALSSSPTLVLFKSGYTVAYPPPEWHLTMHLAPRVLPLPHWHDTTIRMQKFNGSMKERGEQLYFLRGKLRFALDSYEDDCLWKQIPRLLVAFAQEDSRLATATGMPSDTEALGQGTIEAWDKRRSPNQVQRCGSMTDYLRSYIP
jgi:hypothetical protein